MSKKNGKFVVVAILGLVFGISLFAWVIQTKIDLNRGKPIPEAAVEKSAN